MMRLNGARLLSLPEYQSTDAAKFPYRELRGFSGPDVRLGSRLCENSDARRTRRNILEKFRVTRTDNAADMGMDAMLEN